MNIKQNLGEKMIVIKNDPSLNDFCSLYRLSNNNILSLSLDKRIDLYNKSMQYLADDLSVLTPVLTNNIDEYFVKFIRYLPSDCINPNFIKVMSFLKDQGIFEKKNLYGYLSPQINDDYKQMKHLLTEIIHEENEILAKTLIKQGCPISKKVLESSFFSAIETGNTELVNILIENSKGRLNIEQIDRLGDTPLICSLTTKNFKIEIVKLLIEAGANINATTRSKVSVLEWAVMREDLELIKILVEEADKRKIPLNFNRAEKNRWIVLVEAVDRYNWQIGQIFKLLLDAGAKINYDPNSKSISLLYNMKVKKIIPSKQIKALVGNVKNNCHLKEVIRSKAVGHSFQLAGIYESTVSLPKLTYINLEGGSSQIWLNKMSKVSQLMNNMYPDLLSNEQKDLLCQTLNDAANFYYQPIEDIFKRIQAGKPVILPAGYNNQGVYGSHEVFAFIWGSKFIFNHGKNFTVFTFDPLCLDLKFLEIITNPDKEINEFNNILKNQISKKLALKSDHLEKSLQNLCQQQLPGQKVGNCTWASSETVVWSFFQLYEILGVENEKLKKTEFDLKNFLEKSDVAQKKFDNWRMLNQLYLLESYARIRQIRPNSSSDKGTSEQAFEYKIRPELIKRAISEIALTPKIDPRVEQEFEKLKQTLSY